MNHDSDHAGASEHIDFLDQVLQDLFGLGLKLEHCATLLEEAPPQARAHLDEVASALEQIVEPIRERILLLGRSRNLSSEGESREDDG